MALIVSWFDDVVVIAFISYVLWGGIAIWSSKISYNQVLVAGIILTTIVFGLGWLAGFREEGKKFRPQSLQVQIWIMYVVQVFLLQKGVLDNKLVQVLIHYLTMSIVANVAFHGNGWIRDYFWFLRSKSGRVGASTFDLLKNSKSLVKRAPVTSKRQAEPEPRPVDREKAREAIIPVLTSIPEKKTDLRPANFDSHNGKPFGALANALREADKEDYKKGIFDDLNAAKRENDSSKLDEALRKIREVLPDFAAEFERRFIETTAN